MPKPHLGTSICKMGGSLGLHLRPCLHLLLEPGLPRASHHQPAQEILGSEEGIQHCGRQASPVEVRRSACLPVSFSASMPVSVSDAQACMLRMVPETCCITHLRCLCLCTCRHPYPALPLSIYLSIYLPTCLPTYRPTYLANYLPTSLSICSSSTIYRSLIYASLHLPDCVLCRGGGRGGCSEPASGRCQSLTASQVMTETLAVGRSMGHGWPLWLWHDSTPWGQRPAGIFADNLEASMQSLLSCKPRSMQQT